jgi:O-antigen/teichoic acid export membrane protein
MLILWLGMVGAAWSSLFSFGTIVIWRVLFLKKRFGFWPFDRTTWSAWLLIGVVSMLVWLLPSSGHPLLDAGIGVALISALFWPTIHYLRIAPDLSAQLRLLIQRFRS